MAEMEAAQSNLAACEDTVETLRSEVETEKARAEGLSGDLALSIKQCKKANEDLSATTAELGATKV